MPWRMTTGATGATGKAGGATGAVGITRREALRQSWPANAPRLSDKERGEIERDYRRFVFSLVLASAVAFALWGAGWGLGQS